jgi:hypothetical protein
VPQWHPALAVVFGSGVSHLSNPQNHLCPFQASPMLVHNHSHHPPHPAPHHLSSLVSTQPPMSPPLSPLHLIHPWVLPVGCRPPPPLPFHAVHQPNDHVFPSIRTSNLNHLHSLTARVFNSEDPAVTSPFPCRLWPSPLFLHRLLRARLPSPADPVARQRTVRFPSTPSPSNPPWPRLHLCPPPLFPHRLLRARWPSPADPVTRQRTVRFPSTLSPSRMPFRQRRHGCLHHLLIPTAGSLLHLDLSPWTRSHFRPHC